MFLIFFWFFVSLNPGKEIVKIVRTFFSYFFNLWKFKYPHLDKVTEDDFLVLTASKAGVKGFFLFLFCSLVLFIYFFSISSNFFMFTFRIRSYPWTSSICLERHVS